MSLYEELEQAKRDFEAARQKLARAERAVEDEEARQAEAAQIAGFCWPCGSTHSRCPAGIEEGTAEHEPDLARLVELELLPDRAFNEHGELNGKPADYAEDMVTAHECSADECNVCTTCGCTGWSCSWPTHMKDDR